VTFKIPREHAGVVVLGILGAVHQGHVAATRRFAERLPGLRGAIELFLVAAPKLFPARGIVPEEAP
jgi:hypothetical protein